MEENFRFNFRSILDEFKGFSIVWGFIK